MHSDGKLMSGIQSCDGERLDEPPSCILFSHAIDKRAEPAAGTEVVTGASAARL